MHIVETLLILVAACIGFALIARQARLPYAVVLVLGGMALAFIPGVPQVELDPQIALAFFLPPLLQASAYRTDWNGFRGNLRPILLLAVGAVLFTAICIAVVAKALIPGLPWAAAIALGRHRGPARCGRGGLHPAAAAPAAAPRHRAGRREPDQRRLRARALSLRRGRDAGRHLLAGRGGGCLHGAGGRRRRHRLGDGRAAVIAITPRSRTRCSRPR